MIIYENQAIRINFTTGVKDFFVEEVRLKYRDNIGREDTFTQVPTVVQNDEYYIDVPNDFFKTDKIIPAQVIWTFWTKVTYSNNNVYFGNPWQEIISTEGNYPVSRDRIKSFLGITDSTQDSKIDGMIPVFIEQYRTIRNVPWDTDHRGNFHYPPGLEAVIAQMYAHWKKTFDNDGQEVEAEKIGSYSVSFSRSSDGQGYFGYPKSITSQIRKFVRLM